MVWLEDRRSEVSATKARTAYEEEVKEGVWRRRGSLGTDLIVNGLFI